MRRALRFSRQIWLLFALFVTTVFVVLGMTRFHEETATYRPVVPPYDFFWCAKDDDCAVVDQIGCCSCREGGAQTAITAWRRDDLRKFLKSACRPLDQQVCVQVNLCRKHGTARCVDRRCRLILDENK